MTDSKLHYPIVLFDWGDTVMRDDPDSTKPMVEWETLEAVDGVADVLTYLHASGRRVILATSANVSTEEQIWAALKRCELDIYFSKVYCFKNTQLTKGEAFYRFILNDLNVPASEVMMVGDHFEKDVKAPNASGIFGMWFNTKSSETRKSDLCNTVHSMQELLTFFQSLDLNQP